MILPKHEESGVQPIVSLNVGDNIKPTHMWRLSHSTKPLFHAANYNSTTNSHPEANGMLQLYNTLLQSLSIISAFASTPKSSSSLFMLCQRSGVQPETAFKIDAGSKDISGLVPSMRMSSFYGLPESNPFILIDGVGGERDCCNDEPMGMRPMSRFVETVACVEG